MLKIRLMALAFLLVAGCAAPSVGGLPPGQDVTGATPSPPPPLVRFAVKGDWGSGLPEQRSVTEAMCKARLKEPFDAVVTTGDNFYSPDGVAHDANYFKPEACLVAHPGHVWKASWGNHDVAGRATAEQLGAPQKYYSWSTTEFDLFVLDSNRVTDQKQMDWLRGALSESSAAVKIVAFHHPPFTVGGHNNDLKVQEHWVPLFVGSGVSLVLNGHNHGFEHSVVDGVHYVVTGGGGALLYPCLRSEPWLRRCIAVNHFLLVEVSQGKIKVDAVGIDGADVDSFTFDAMRLGV